MTALKLSEPHAPRPVTFLELWESPGWRVKVYGIVYRGGRPRPELVAAGKGVAAGVLDHFAAKTPHYGVGYLGVHDGRGANFVFVDWWAAENELHHHVFLSPTDAPAELRPATSADPCECVWDLAVMWHERQAWVETVLADPARPDLYAYLARQMNAVV